MNIFIDFGCRISKVNVVSVNKMFEHKIRKTKWGDQWTNDTVANCDCKYGYDPGILDAIVEFEGRLLFFERK